MQRVLGMKGEIARPYGWATLLSVVFCGTLLVHANLFPTPEHYLALHAGLEFFSVAVSVMVLALGWNLRKAVGSARRVWLGAAFLGAGLLDLAHTLSYAGMPLFITPSGTEKAIHFWLAARTLVLIGLIGYPFVGDGRWSSVRALVVTAGGLALALAWSWMVLFQPDRMPHTFVPGQGVTTLKLAVEYVLAGLYLLAAVLLARHAMVKRDKSANWLAAAAWVLALTELYFTLYVDVSDFFNVMGHVFKIAGFAMIYRAVFVSGVREPHDALARERALLRALIDSVPDLIAFRDLRGRFLGCNKAFAAAYGVREAELLGRRETDVFPQLAGLAGGTPDAVVAEAVRVEEWLEGPDGTLRLLDTLRAPFCDERGESLGEIRVSRDFTERRRVREQIAERERRVMLALEGAELGLWDWDVPSGRTSYSPAWGRMLGFEPHEFEQDVETWESLVHPDDWSDIRNSLEPHLRGERDAYQAEYRLRHKDGRWVWVLAAGRVLDRDERGQPLRMVGILQDVSQRKVMEESLVQLATSDPLTGLWNRRHFAEMVRGELGRLRRHQSTAGLLLLDLDHFKRINDTHGHAAGDEVLRHFTATVTAQLREADVFARLGGEEFAILLPCIDARGALRVAERLCRIVAAHPAAIDSGPLVFTVSIGVTMLSLDDEDHEAAYARADEALYEAKHAGRNRALMSSADREDAAGLAADVSPASL